MATVYVVAPQLALVEALSTKAISREIVPLGGPPRLQQISPAVLPSPRQLFERRTASTVTFGKAAAVDFSKHLCAAFGALPDS
jgi:hypothetical protein